MFLVTSEPYHDNSEPVALCDSRDAAVEKAREIVSSQFSSTVWEWDGGTFTELGSWHDPKGLGRSGETEPVWVGD